jgi:hypothetical protein
MHQTVAHADIWKRKTRLREIVHATSTTIRSRRLLPLLNDVILDSNSLSKPQREVNEKDLYRDTKSPSSSGSEASSGDGFIVREENDDYWCIACNAIFTNKNQVWF